MKQLQEIQVIKIVDASLLKTRQTKNMLKIKRRSLVFGLVKMLFLAEQHFRARVHLDN